MNCKARLAKRASLVYNGGFAFFHLFFFSSFYSIQGVSEVIIYVFLADVIAVPEEEEEDVCWSFFYLLLLLLLLLL